MKFIDMHCDTLVPFARRDEYTLFSSNQQVDFQKMKRGDALAQFFAVFFPPKQFMDSFKKPMTDEEYFNTLVEGLHRDVEAHSDIIALATNADEIVANNAAGKMSAVLTIEDSRMVNGDLDMIRKVYDKGVRCMSLTWNFENCFGFPNSTDPEIMNKPLKPFGIEGIKLMNELGILVDVSHLNDGGFWDVVKYTDKPFVATHSNARAYCGHQRNLTDEMIKALANKGGVMGLNFAPQFMDPRMVIETTTISDIIGMAKHIRNVGGIDVIGLGTDFDGIEGIQEISCSSMLPVLWDEFKKAGFTEDEIDKISHNNVLRVIKEAMK
ncbi:MAG: dipeptidase [Oscillospiraceae bacterium]|nr:dipeptidase [Oscillospiraceae bacterium]